MARRARYRYLGDLDRLLVHDLDREAEGCEVDGVFDRGAALRFNPDRLGEAQRRAFEPCPRCLGEAAQPPGGVGGLANG